MKHIMKIKQQKKIKADTIKYKNADHFFALNLKYKVFKTLLSNLEINVKLAAYYIKFFKNKRKLVYAGKIIGIIKLNHIDLLLKEDRILNELLKIKRKFYAKLLLETLKKSHEDCIDQLMKKALIEKLKNTAKSYLGTDFN